MPRRARVALALIVLAAAAGAWLTLAPEPTLERRPPPPPPRKTAPSRPTWRRPSEEAPRSVPVRAAAPGEAAALAGEVRDAASGAPIASARVALRPAGGGPVQGTATDGAGRFAFASVPATALELVAVAPGWVVPEPVRVPEGAKRAGVRLERGFAIAGTVVGPEGPVAATVELHGAARFAGEPVHASPGGFELRGVPPGEGYELLVRADGLTEASFPVPPVRGDVRGLEVVLRRLVLRGRLEPRGVALGPDVRVDVAPEPVPARVTGATFEALLPRAGEWLVRARQAGASSVWERVEDIGRDVVLVIEPPGRIEGRLLDPQRRPIAGLVRARPEPAWRADAASAVASAEGRFVLDVPRARYTLTGVAGGFGSATRTVDAPATVELVLEELEGAAPVVARAFVRDGKPLAGVLTLEPESDDPHLEVPLDASGRPDLRALGAGRWSVSFPEAGPEGELRAWLLELDVAPGEAVTLGHAETEPRGRLEGIVRGAPRDAQVEVRPVEPPAKAFAFLAARALESDGRFVFGAVPPGRYLVRATWEDGVAEAEVEVRPGVGAWAELAAFPR